VEHQQLQQYLKNMNTAKKQKEVAQQQVKAPVIKVINEITYNGNEIPFSVSLKAIMACETQLHEELGDMVRNYNVNRAVVMCKEAIKAGFINRKLNERADEVTDDFAIELIENVAGLYPNIMKTYDTAYAKLYNIQVEGN